MRRCALTALTAIVFACLAAPVSAGVAVFVEYLDVPPAAADQFTSVVTGPLRKLNQARLERKEIFAWYHYSARFPLGETSDYTDVIVTVFTDFASLENPAVSEAYAQWVHDSEVYQGVPGVRSADYYGKVEYTHVTVDFLTAGDRGAEAFLALMRDQVKPRLQARADAGEVVNWALFARRLPLGTERGYEYALVSRFKGFGNREQPQITGPEATHLRQSAVGNSSTLSSSPSPRV